MGRALRGRGGQDGSEVFSESVLLLQRRESTSKEAVEMRNRLALIGSIVSLSLTTILAVRLIMIGNAPALVILAPALLGAILGLRLTNRLVLVVAAVLTALTAAVILIGGIGLLYIPSIVLLVSAAIANSRVDVGR
jgi:hypothetical protein